MTESADKRTVSTDALETLGMIHTREEKRDAIHLAVIPMEAGWNLSPGCHVKIEDGKAMPAEIGKGVGIVDPFLPRVVNPGEKFWLVIYPRVITSLRHVWTHPQFPDEQSTYSENKPTQIESIAYLNMVADKFGITFEELLAYAADYAEHDEYAVQGGRWEGEYLSDPETFWEHYDIVTGSNTPHVKRNNFFSCSC